MSVYPWHPALRKCPLFYTPRTSAVGLALLASRPRAPAVGWLRDARPAVVMAPSQRVSDGQIAGYGKQVYDALAVDAAWRSRIAQEGVGYRSTDETGSSTSISMIWCPSAKLQPKGRTAKRPSEIKDLIGYGHRPTPAAQAPAPALAAAPVPPPSASQRSLCSSRASNRSGTSINTAQLDSEGSRLQVCRRAPPLTRSGDARVASHSAPSRSPAFGR